MRRLALVTLCLSLVGSAVLTGCAGSKPSEGGTKTPVKKSAELEAEVLKSRQEAEAQEKKLTQLREEKAQLEADLERKNNPQKFAPAPAATPAATAPAATPAAAKAAPAAAPAKAK
jgi:hypothetical protein